MAIAPQTQTPDVSLAEPSAAEALLGALLQPAFTVDRSLRLTRFNSRFADSVRAILAREPLVGMHIDELLPQAEHRRLHRYWRDLVRRSLEGRPVHAETSLISGGYRRRFHIAGHPIGEAGSVRGAAFSFQETPETRIEETPQFFELILADTVTRDYGVRRTLARVCESFCESAAWDLGLAWMIPSARSETAELTAVWQRQPSTALDSPERLSLHERIVPARHRVLADGHPVWVRDLRRGAPGGESPQGYRSALLMPIFDSRRVLAVLGFYSLQRKKPERHIDPMLIDAGRKIGRIIERKRIDEERQQLQRAVEKRATEWSATFDAIEAPIILVDAETRVHRLNAAARLLAGVERTDEVAGKKLIELGSGTHWGIMAQLATTVRDSCMGSTMQWHDDAEELYWDIDASYYSGKGRDDERVVIVLRDITRMVQLQESLRRGEQLSAMGELVAGVAHEVRNPLFGISATLDALEVTIGRTEANADLFDTMRKWVERLNELMRQLLEYGKAWSFDLQRGAIEEVITSVTQTSIPDEMRSRIDVELPPHEACHPMLMNSSRLSQVFQNLLANALQHSPPQGRITIRAANRVLGGNRWIECEVSDSGPGFDPGDLHRIFQPFFTRRRGGTGLGLSIVQRITEEHGGSVLAYNTDRGGAAIRLRFPAIDDSEKR
jgi:signal transduction histidine kinase